jgi:hypothetical protein
MCPASSRLPISLSRASDVSSSWPALAGAAKSPCAGAWPPPPPSCQPGCCRSCWLLHRGVLQAPSAVRLAGPGSVGSAVAAGRTALSHAAGGAGCRWALSASVGAARQLGPWDTAGVGARCAPHAAWLAPDWSVRSCAADRWPGILTSMHCTVGMRIRGLPICRSYAAAARVALRQSLRASLPVRSIQGACTLAACWDAGAGYPPRVCTAVWVWWQEPQASHARRRLRVLACLARVQCCRSGWAWINKRRVTHGLQKVRRQPRVAIGALGPDLRQEPDCKRSIHAGPN